MPVAESPPPGFYPPDPYAPIWVWVGAGILVVVALWYVLVWRVTRERPVVIPPRATPERMSRLRADYVRQIDAVVRRTESGEITDRRAHQQISVLLRHFVQEASGVRAPTMTLTDLTASGPRLTPVSRVVAALYPGEFAPQETRTLAGAAAAAKEVVSRWT